MAMDRYFAFVEEQARNCMLFLSFPINRSYLAKKKPIGKRCLCQGTKQITVSTQQNSLPWITSQIAHNKKAGIPMPLLEFLDELCKHMHTIGKSRPNDKDIN